MKWGANRIRRSAFLDKAPARTPNNSMLQQSEKHRCCVAIENRGRIAHVCLAKNLRTCEAAFFSPAKKLATAYAPVVFNNYFGCLLESKAHPSYEQLSSPYSPRVLNAEGTRFSQLTACLLAAVGSSRSTNPSQFNILTNALQFYSIRLSKS